MKNTVLSDGLFNSFGYQWPIFRMNEAHIIFRIYRFLPGLYTKQPEMLFVPSNFVCCKVPVPGCQFTGFQCYAQALFAFSYGSLGFLLFADVLHSANHTYRFACFIAYNKTPVSYTYISAICLPVVKFVYPQIFPSIYCLSESIHNPLTVIRVYKRLVPGYTMLHFAMCVAKDSLHHRTPPYTVFYKIYFPDNIFSSLHCILKALHGLS